MIYLKNPSTQVGSCTDVLGEVRSYGKWPQVRYLWRGQLTHSLEDLLVCTGQHWAWVGCDAHDRTPAHGLSDTWVRVLWAAQLFCGSVERS